MKKNRQNLSKELHKQTMGYVLAGLGIVAGLAWNDAIAGLIEQLFPFQRGTVIAKIIYAFVITGVVALFSLRISKGGDTRSEE